MDFVKRHLSNPDNCLNFEIPNQNAKVIIINAKTILITLQLQIFQKGFCLTKYTASEPHNFGSSLLNDATTPLYVPATTSSPFCGA
jgi:hypothetical protein